MTTKFLPLDFKGFEWAIKECASPICLVENGKKIPLLENSRRLRVLREKYEHSRLPLILQFSVESAEDYYRLITYSVWGNYHASEESTY